MSLFDVFPGSKSPEFVNAIVEIPKGRRSKFEVDKETGLIQLPHVSFSFVKLVASAKRLRTSHRFKIPSFSNDRPWGQRL